MVRNHSDDKVLVSVAGTRAERDVFISVIFFSKLELLPLPCLFARHLMLELISFRYIAFSNSNDRVRKFWYRFTTIPSTSWRLTPHRVRGIFVERQGIVLSKNEGCRSVESRVSWLCSLMNIGSQMGIGVITPLAMCLILRPRRIDDLVYSLYSLRRMFRLLYFIYILLL